MALKEYYGEDVVFIIADLSEREAYQFLEMDQFEVTYIPKFYFIDARGNTVSAVEGVFNFDQMKTRIDQTLPQ